MIIIITITSSSLLPQHLPASAAENPANPMVAYVCWLTSTAWYTVTIFAAEMPVSFVQSKLRLALGPRV
jgi:hypothetical protein